MKKVLLPVVLVVTLAVGGWFLFFQDDSGAENPGKETPDKGVVEGEKGKEGQEQPKTPDEKLRDLLRAESANPPNYMEIDFSFKKKFLGDYEVEGSITNQAQETYYKDPEVRMYFMDKNYTKLDSVSEIIFGEFGPGDKLDFVMSHKGPKSTQLIDISVIRAKVSE